MNETAFLNYINATFPAAELLAADGNTFFYGGPERTMPFATLIVNDLYDQFSNLNREGVFRLNLAVRKPEFVMLFGVSPAAFNEPSETSGASAENATSPRYDFTALDQFMPHPIYANYSWACVLNPSEATFEKLKPLLAQAYENAAKKHKPQSGQTG